MKNYSKHDVKIGSLMKMCSFFALVMLIWVILVTVKMRLLILKSNEI